MYKSFNAQQKSKKFEYQANTGNFAKNREIITITTTKRWFTEGCACPGGALKIHTKLTIRTILMGDFKNFSYYIKGDTVLVYCIQSYCLKLLRCSIWLGEEFWTWELSLRQIIFNTYERICSWKKHILLYKCRKIRGSRIFEIAHRPNELSSNEH